MARACVYLMNFEGDIPDLVNIGTGQDLSIASLVQMVKEVIGYKGEIIFDTTKPDGPMKKQLDVSRITALGWKPEIELHEGIATAFFFFFFFFFLITKRV